jgi:gas vesicle protein
MRSDRTWRRARKWVRVAAKVGLLCTDPKIRNAVTDEIKGRMDDWNDTVSSKYETAVNRVEAAAAALRGKSYWPSRVGSFFLGVGVGAGLGILLAPAPGTETRGVVRDKAVDIKNRMFESTSQVQEKMRQSGGMPFTGTDG